MFIKEFETFELFQSAKPINYDQFISNKANKQVLNFTVNTCQNFIALQKNLSERVQRLIINIDHEIEN